MGVQLKYKTGNFKCRHVCWLLDIRFFFNIKNKIRFSDIPRRQAVPLSFTIKQISIRINGSFTIWIMALLLKELHFFRY